MPKTIAAGKPWVFRADHVDRDAVVDLALLAKGFTSSPGPSRIMPTALRCTSWDAVYKYSTDHGFSKKPVLEGTGGAAGEAYAWAIENPDKVSCIYGENPVLRSTMTKTPPLDNLAPLAKAGVPLLHVCGSLDPWSTSHTRMPRSATRNWAARSLSSSKKVSDITRRRQGSEIRGGFHRRSPASKRRSWEYGSR